jgi:hypothetical protein
VLKFVVIMRFVGGVTGDGKKTKERDLGGGLKEKGRRVSTSQFTRTNKGRPVGYRLP